MPPLAAPISLRFPRYGFVQPAEVMTHRTDDETVLKLLNDALATELVCMLRCRRHHFMSRGIRSKGMAAVFLAHATDALNHADQLASRIDELGGMPDFSPDNLSGRSHARYTEGLSLSGRLRENMEATHLAITGYRELSEYLAGSDPTTQDLLKSILAREEQHVDELADQLVAMHMRRQVKWPEYPAAAGQSQS